MTKIKSFYVSTMEGGGDLDIFEKSGGYSACFQGSSGLAHETRSDRETLMANIKFTLVDTSLDNIIENCRVEIEKRDSRIISFKQK